MTMHDEMSTDGFHARVILRLCQSRRSPVRRDPRDCSPAPPVLYPYLPDSPKSAIPIRSSVQDHHRFRFSDVMDMHPKRCDAYDPPPPSLEDDTEQATKGIEWGRAYPYPRNPEQA